MLRWKQGFLPKAMIVGVAVLLLGASTDTQAQSSFSNHNAPYLRMGVGARALGMGGAFVGVADDATAAYWNPAGLAWSSGWEFTGMYTAGMNVDRNHNYVGLAHNAEKFAFALQWTNAGMTDIMQTDGSGRDLGEFNYGDNALALSLAKRFDIVALGVTGKFLRQGIGADIDGTDGINGFGLDIGLGLVVNEWARIGLAVQNLAGKLGSDDDANSIPATMRAGVALMPFRCVTTAFDVVKTRDESDYSFHAGAEVGIPVTEDLGTALRIGLNHNKFAGGLGIEFNFLSFDYAYVIEPEKFLDENHRLSVSLRFGDDRRLARSCERLYDVAYREPVHAEPETIEVIREVIIEKEVPAEVTLPTLAYINFKFGTADISGADPIPVLEEVVRVMSEAPELKVKITGHTDNIGAESFNMQLSIRRAESVKNYLVGRGVDPGRLLTEGRGETQPIDTNDTDIGRARNRRIEFSVIE